MSLGWLIITLVTIKTKSKRPRINLNSLSYFSCLKNGVRYIVCEHKIRVIILEQ